MPYRDPSSPAAKASYAKRAQKYAGTAKGRATRKRTHHPKYTRARRDEFRALIAAIKSVPCMDCGGRFDPVCMDFDHRPGEIKSFTIGGTAACRGRDALHAEITKCDIVCSNCHRLRSYRKRDHRIVCKQKVSVPSANQESLNLGGAT